MRKSIANHQHQFARLTRWEPPSRCPCDREGAPTARLMSNSEPLLESVPLGGIADRLRVLHGYRSSLGDGSPAPPTTLLPELPRGGTQWRTRHSVRED